MFEIDTQICVRCNLGATTETAKLGPVSVMSLPDGSGELGPIHAMCWQLMFEETKRAFDTDYYRSVAISYYSTTGVLTPDERRAARERGELWRIEETDIYVNLEGALECEKLHVGLVKILTPAQVITRDEWARQGIGAN